MTIPRIFVRISILIILNVFVRLPLVNSELRKTKNFTNDLRLESAKLKTHFPRKFDGKLPNRVEMKQEQSYVKNQNLDDLDEMCLIALNQSGHIDRDRDASSSTQSSRPKTTFQRNAAFVSKNIKDTVYTKLLYKCGDNCVPRSNRGRGDNIEELFEILIAPSDVLPGRAAVFRSTNITDVELIGTVKEAFFPVEQKSWLPCCFSDASFNDSHPDAL